MTGFMHEREFSRKSFVKGGGALIVGFSFAGLAGKAGAATATTAGPPDSTLVDSWIAINADNTATIYFGKINQTGTPTALLQIAAEELDLGMDQVHDVRHDTNVTPNQGATTGSNGTAGGGPAVRAAAATAKTTLLALASTQLGVPTTSLTVAKGVISGGGKSLKYSDLIAGKLFNVTMPASYNMAGTSNAFGPLAGLLPGTGTAKAPSDYKVVGTRVPRVDIPDKITGKYTYLQNVRIPGMLHGRVVRTRGQQAYGAGPTLVSVDKSSIAHIPNVQVLTRGNFVGVVAPKEYDAIQAASQLKVTWAEPSVALVPNGNTFGALRSAPVTESVLVNKGDLASGFAQAAKTVQASFNWPFHTHGALGPHAGLADVQANSAFVMSSSQDIYGLRAALSATLGMDQKSIRVQWYEGAGNYGNAPWDDASHSAAILSQLAGKPVRVQFMRWDEHGWDNYSTAQLFDVKGGVDANGNIVAYQFTSTQPQWVISPAAGEMVGTATPFLLDFTENVVSGGGDYTIANRYVTSRGVSVKTGWPRSSYMRAPGANSALFASEQVIDELAHASNMDPLQFRVQNANDPRWVAVLGAVKTAAKWQPKVAASKLATGNVVTGRGVAIGGYVGTRAAVVADIEVNKKTGKIKVKHVYSSQDAGLAINPASVENQMEGGMIQMVSRTLFEELKIGKKGVTGLDWVTYPIMRFKDAPAATTVVVQRSDQPSTGSGEPASAPIAAAIANAFFDATGVRIRSVPMTPAVVRAALAAGA